jgi:hypothetical protein
MFQKIVLWDLGKIGILELAGGQIRYQVQGTAPCSKLVVSWIGVRMYLLY